MALGAVLWKISSGLATLDELLVNCLLDFLTVKAHSIAEYLAASVAPNAVSQVLNYQ